MHVVVFTRSSSVARALVSTLICCSILQCIKRTKPSADTWAIDPWVHVVPSFSARPCFKVYAYESVMICFLWQHEIHLWYLPGTTWLYWGPSPVDLACLRNHLLHARRYWYCGRHPQDTAVGRDITHYSFVSIRAVVYGLSSNYFQMKVRLLWDRGFHRNSSLQAAWDTSILFEAKQGCGVVSCTTFSYWGACWSKVLVLIYMISYVRTWGLLLLIFHWNISFFFRNLVVGSRYHVFFSFSITCGPTNAGRILFDIKWKRENSRMWPFRVRVMLLLDRSRSWMILTGTPLWIACGHTSSTSQLDGVYCNKLTADAGRRRICIYVGQITIYALCRSSRS